MTLSENVEADISAQLDTYGNTVTIQKQTSTYNEYDELATWTDSTTASAKVIIKPFLTRRMKGEEWRLYKGGLIKETDLICFLKVTETIEESTDHTTATRYLIVFNSTRYYIVKDYNFEMQDNNTFKKCYLRKLTT